jgi:hypothetical protein
MRSPAAHSSDRAGGGPVPAARGRHDSSLVMALTAHTALELGVRIQPATVCGTRPAGSANPDSNTAHTARALPGGGGRRRETRVASAWRSAVGVGHGRGDANWSWGRSFQNTCKANYNQ